MKLQNIFLKLKSLRYMCILVMILYMIVVPICAIAEVNVSIDGSTVIGKYVVNGTTIWSGVAGTDDSRTINETLNNASIISIVDFKGNFTLTKQITSGKSLTLMNASGANATFNLTGLSSGEAGFLITGALGTATALTSDVASGSNSFTVADASGISTNTILYVYDDVIWSTTFSTRKSGEVHKVASVVGNTVTLQEPIITGYTTANNAYARPATPVNVTMTGMYLYTVSPTAYRDGIKTNYARDVNFSFMRMTNIGGHGAAFWNTINVTAHHNEITGANMAGEGYGLSATDASANINFAWNNITNCRHPIAVDGTGSSSLGQVRNITVSDSLLKAWINDADASYALDSHTNTLSMIVRNVTLYKGSAGSTATAGIGSKILDFQNVTIIGNGSTGYGLAPRGIITNSLWYVRNISFNGVDLGFYPFTSGGATFDYIYFHDLSGSSSPYLYLTSGLSGYTLIDTDQMIPFVGFTGTIHYGVAPLSVPLTRNSSIIKIDSYKWNVTNVTGNNTPVTLSTSENPTLVFPIGNWTVQLQETNEAGTNTSTQVYWVNTSIDPTGLSTTVNITYNRLMLRDVANSTWFGLRNGSGTLASTPGTQSYSGFIDTGGSPINQEYKRNIFYAGYANTGSAVPVGTVFDSGTLTVYGAGADQTVLGAVCSVLVDLHPLSSTYTTLVAEDYNRSTFTLLSDNCVVGSTGNASYTFTLNANGVSYLNTTGPTAIALMSNRSVLLQNYTWSSTTSSSRNHHRPLDYLNGSFSPSFLLEYHVEDVISPENAHDFTNSTNCSQTIISWIQSGDSDFNHTYTLWENIWVGNLSNATISYNKTGLLASTTYTLSTKACDLLGNCNNDWANYTIITSPCLAAAFSANNTSICGGSTVTFTDESVGSPISWYWEFDGNNTSVLQNSSFQYNIYGNFSVNMRATDIYGSDWENKTNYIHVNDCSPPVSAFSANNTSICIGEFINFTDMSMGSPTSWYWEFDNSNTSIVHNPLFQYNTSGIFSVNMRSSNIYGSDWENKTGYITVSDCSSPLSNFNKQLADKMNSVQGFIVICIYIIIGVVVIASIAKFIGHNE